MTTISSANQPIVFDPKIVHEALHFFASKHWKTKMQEELDLLQEHGTWEYADLPKERKTIGSKWIFKKKIGGDGLIETFKAHFVAKDFHKSKALTLINLLHLLHALLQFAYL